MYTMRNMIQSVLVVGLMVTSTLSWSQPVTGSFPWPAGKRVAISLTFDDARKSQPNGGAAVLDQYGVKATFFIVPGTAKESLEGWKKVVASGHEIGNHSLTHPCTGNFPWSKSNALENYTLEQMHSQLVEANKYIETLLGVKSEVFAYPCGNTFVGRGRDTKSYVPVVPELFLFGRVWLDEGRNDPAFCDLAQPTGMEREEKDLDRICAPI